MRRLPLDRSRHRLWFRRHPLLLVCCLLLNLTDSAGLLPGSRRVEAQKPGPRYLQPVARSGASRYKPGDWGMVSFEIANPSDEPAEVIAGLQFEDRPTLQFARKLWLPARSKRQSWYSIRVPADIGVEEEALNPQVFLIDRTNGADDWVGARTGERFTNATSFPMEHSALTGIIRDDGGDEMPYQTLLTMRYNRNLNRMTIPFSDPFLPPIPEVLESLDQLLIASDRLVNDQAGIEAIRRWVLGGGRMWIMLDQVDPATVRKLMGDTFDAQIIDRTEIVSVHLQGMISPSVTATPPAPYELDEPVELVRVLPGSSDVWYTQDGWPAAFWYSFGEGQVLFTTLGARGWVRPRTEQDSQSPDPSMACNYRAQIPLEMLAARMFSVDAGTSVPNELFEDYVTEQIGYEIVSRSTVTGILGLFCGILLICGLYFMKQQRLERMAWIIPLTGIGVATLMILLGRSYQNAVPATVAVMQLVEAPVNAHDVPVRGIVAAYHQRPTTDSVGSNGGGRFDPDMSGEESSIIRFEMNDVGDWDWAMLRMPTGVRIASNRTNVSMTTPVFGRARFGPEGLEGEYGTGAFENPSDMVISVPLQGRVAVSPQSESRFLSTLDDVLVEGAFLKDAVLTEEQRRREQVYQKLFTETESFPRTTTLFVWTDPLDTGLKFPESQRFAGGALLCIPLQIEPTPPGTEVAIPSPFIGFQTVAGPAGEPVTSIYNNRKREWLESKNSTEAYFEFQLPGEVLPLDLKSGSLNLNIDASQRPVEIIVVNNGEKRVAQKLDSPVGRFTVPLDDEILGTSGAAGRVWIGLRVGRHELADDNENADLSTNWLIKSIGLDVRGTTVSPPAVAAAP